MSESRPSSSACSATAVSGTRPRNHEPALVVGHHVAGHELFEGAGAGHRAAVADVDGCAGDRGIARRDDAAARAGLQEQRANLFTVSMPALTCTSPYAGAYLSA